MAFDSRAANLVRGDDNGKSDVFVRDTKKGKTTQVSLDTKGRPPEGHELRRRHLRQRPLRRLRLGRARAGQGGEGRQAPGLRLRSQGQETRIVSTDVVRRSRRRRLRPAGDLRRRHHRRLHAPTRRTWSPTTSTTRGRVREPSSAPAAGRSASTRPRRLPGPRRRAGADDHRRRQRGRLHGRLRHASSCRATVYSEVFVKNLDTRALELISQAPGRRRRRRPRRPGRDHAGRSLRRLLLGLDEPRHRPARLRALRPRHPGPRPPHADDHQGRHRRRHGPRLRDPRLQPLDLRRRHQGRLARLRHRREHRAARHRRGDDRAGDARQQEARPRLPGRGGVHLRRGEHAGRLARRQAGRASSRSAWATSRATRSTSTSRSR